MPKQPYFLERHILSINSSDRDYSLWKNSNHFEINIPSDTYKNIQTIKLLPLTLNFKSENIASKKENTTFKFNITPNINYQHYTIYNELMKNPTFTVTIPDGNYNAKNLIATIENQMNLLVTNFIRSNGEIKTEYGNIDGKLLTIQTFYNKSNLKNLYIEFKNKENYYPEFLDDDWSDGYMFFYLDENKSEYFKKVRCKLLISEEEINKIKKINDTVTLDPNDNNLNKSKYDVTINSIKCFTFENTELVNINDFSYNRFKVFYNEVSEKITFGNTFDTFRLDFDNPNTLCDEPTNGIAKNLGFENKLLFSRENVNEVTSYNSVPPNKWLKLDEDKFNKINIYFKKFVYSIEATSVLNLSYDYKDVYLDIKEINQNHEVLKNDSTPIFKNNINNVKTNSFYAFLKNKDKDKDNECIQDFDCVSTFNPPLDNLKKLSIKFRYHNGVLVENLDDNIVINLEVNSLTPDTINIDKINTPETY